MTSRRSFLVQSAGAFAAASLPSISFAESYPTRPIKIIVTFPAGGPSDTAVRIVQPSMQKALGQPVIVENVGGAAGVLGLNRAKQSDPDGYTLVRVASPHHTTAAATKPGSVDLMRDFEPVGITGIATFTLVVSPLLGAEPQGSGCACEVEAGCSEICEPRGRIGAASRHGDAHRGDADRSDAYPLPAAKRRQCLTSRPDAST